MEDIYVNTVMTIREEKISKICEKNTMYVPEISTRENDQNWIMITFKNYIPSELEAKIIDVEFKNLDKVDKVYMYSYRDILLVSWVIEFKKDDPM